MTLGSAVRTCTVVGGIVVAGILVSAPISACATIGTLVGAGMIRHYRRRRLGAI